MNEEIRAAPYSNTDKAETQAVDTFKKLLNHEKVKADIKERDKYPNIDGYVELVNGNRSPIGKLEVQIRTLPENGDKHKLQCPISLISYSEASTCNPVLLIGVDVNHNKSFWIHVNNSLISELHTEDQKTITITFKKENIIDNNSSYIEDWKKITESYKKKIKEYDKLKDSYKNLSEKSNPALRIVKDDFIKIHFFLDSFNSLLENEFLIIKKRFYPNSWKVGLAYYRFEDNMIHYALYPISTNKNDVQIKEVNEGLHRELEKEGLGFTAHFAENPIKSNPKGYALEIVEAQMLRLLKNRLLKHDVSEFLAKEFIFGFIDRFHQQMGLDKKDAFNINEIEYAFYKYLPIWMDEAIKFLIKNQRNGIKNYSDCLYRKPYFDPDMLISQIMDNERKQVEEKVKERITQNDSIPRIPIGNGRFPLKIFEEMFLFLKSREIKDINRVYSPKDYSRLKDGSGWIWNTFSPDAVKNNLRIFFDSLPKVYSELMSHNFPEIKEKLLLFKGISKVMIKFDVKEEYKSFQDSPKIQFFYLSDGSKDGLEVEIYEEGENEEVPEISHENFKKEVKTNGKKYKLISMSTGILDFIYDDLPMFNFIYKILEENLKSYFNSIKSD